MLMSDIEIITDGGRRRRWSAAEKRSVSVRRKAQLVYGNSTNDCSAEANGTSPVAIIGLLGYTNRTKDCCFPLYRLIACRSELHPSIIKIGNSARFSRDLEPRTRPGSSQWPQYL